ncbi:MAG: methyl-accepting chemotaxis protein [Desulfarculaceae bacterium]|jgi:methyl-accepting chemotaxis protein
MKSRSLAFKLMTGGIIIVLIPLAVVGIISVMNASDALESVSRNQARQIAIDLAGTVQAMLSKELKIAIEMATVPMVVQACAQAAAGGSDKAQTGISKAGEWLSTVGQKIGEEYESILVCDNKGEVIADSQKGKSKGISVGDRDYFKAAREGKASISPPVKSRLSGKPVVVLAAPVVDGQGKFLGIVGIILKTEELSKKVTAVKVGKTGYPWLVDHTGLVVAHPNPDHILKTNLAKLKGMEEFMKTVLSGKEGVGSYVFDGYDKTSGYAPVPVAGWAVGFTQNTDEFLQAARSIRNLTLWVGGIALALTIFGVLLFSRSITRPINNASIQLNVGSDQVAAASGEVAKSGQALAEGTSQQAASIEETSASLEELTSMTKQNAENAGQADSMMKEASEIVVRANNSMKELRQAMEKINSASDETAKIIKTIDEIAFQTNLLALNAAVEAARAGEAGAGFAVVADEVRNLAMRAAEAAKTTASLIEENIKDIKTGSELVVTTDEAFTQVQESASKVGELVAEISAASKEQSQGIDQINTAVTEMDKVTQSTAAQAEESAAAAEELSAQAEEIRGISVALAAVVGGSRAGGMGAPARGKRKKPKALPGPEAGPEAHKAAASGPRRAEKEIPMEEEDFKDF